MAIMPHYNLLQLNFLRHVLIYENLSTRPCAFGAPIPFSLKISQERIKLKSLCVQRDLHSFTASMISLSLTVRLPACSARSLLRSAISLAISSTDLASSLAALLLALAPVSLIILFSARVGNSPISHSKYF